MIRVYTRNSHLFIINTTCMQEGYWGSAVLAESNDYGYDLFLHPCPPGYCKCSQNTSLGSTSCGFTYTNSDPDAQCVDERKGIENTIR